MAKKKSAPKKKAAPKKSSAAFGGFPKETLEFLCGLRANNKKTWFDKHRSEYDDHLMGPAKEFVEAVGVKLKKIVPAIQAIPKVNGSIFRINRDTRFSTDKTPYKDHLDMIFWEGDKKSTGSKMFLRISPDKVYTGAGFHSGCPDLLKSFRNAVADEASGKELASIAKKLRKKGLELEGQHYKRIPRGFSDDGPAGEFLLHDSLHIVYETDPATACDSNFVDTCVKYWKGLMPFHRWLTDNL